MSDDEQLTSPTVFRRQLGRELRALRENAGYTIEAAAKRMELSRSKYGRVEHGMVSVRSLDVQQMCEVFGASAQLTKALVELAKKTRERGWWHSFNNVMPETFELYVGLESTASMLRQYDSELVPGLMQTEAYAAELFRADNPGMENAVIERRVALRVKRQRVLFRVDPPAAQVSVTLSEAILRRPIGGRAVMADQLAHLNELGTLPNVTIQVVPFSAGLHAGVMSRPFTILHFLDATEPPTVYVDGYAGDLYLEKKDQVDQYDRAFREIVNRSLSEQASRDLIAGAVKEYQS